MKMDKIIQDITEKLTIEQKEYLKTITDDKEKINIMCKLIENYRNGDFIFKDIVDKEGKMIGVSEDQLRVFNLDKQLESVYESITEIDEQIKSLENKKKEIREILAKKVRDFIEDKLVDGEWEFVEKYSDGSTPYKIENNYVYKFVKEKDYIKVLGNHPEVDFYRNSFGENCRHDYMTPSTDYLRQNPDKYDFKKYLNVINILKQVI